MSTLNIRTGGRVVGRVIALVMTTGLVMSGCSVDPVSIPSPTGPSELSLSLELSATPDVISQDGTSTSRLTIQARGPNSLPVGGVALRVDMLVPTDQGLVEADYGTLSDRWPTTTSDGRASVVYRAPAPPAPSVTSDTTITLRVTPIGSNYAGAVPRVVEVRLLRPGVIRPPTRMVPKFTYSPTNLREFDTIFFDASTSADPDGQIVSYFWQFGDGTTSSGRQTTHAYGLTGSYGVVLTVSDAYGTSVSTPVTVLTVGTSALPTARFTISPTDPRIATPVIFNASASTAAPGRRLVSFAWDFGDGRVGEGQSVSYTYATPGAYTVVLVVTDDGGKQAVVSQEVEVGDLGSPIASFTISPTNPTRGLPVIFNAEKSTAAFGKAIKLYEWDFGDGESGVGVTVNHVYATASTYAVTLTVTDTAGIKSKTAVSVTVCSSGPS